MDQGCSHDIVCAFVCVCMHMAVGRKEKKTERTKCVCVLFPCDKKSQAMAGSVWYDVQRWLHFFPLSMFLFCIVLELPFTPLIMHFEISSCMHIFHCNFYEYVLGGSGGLGAGFLVWPWVDVPTVYVEVLGCGIVYKWEYMSIRLSTWCVSAWAEHTR